MVRKHKITVTLSWQSIESDVENKAYRMARLAKLGGESSPCSPSEFKSLVQSELKKYAEIVKASGARVD